jgi:hypothetical protein
LIGGPLNACIEAQALAAKTTWEFIKNVGLNEDPQTKQRSAINVTFQYQKGSEMANLVVPLLTIVPIPYIAIDTIDINFKATISASSSSVNEETSSQQMGGEVAAHAEFGWGFLKVSADFKANYSSKKDSKATQESKYSVEYTMDVAVHAGQDSMPAGLATVLGILRESITSGTPGGKLTTTVNSVTLDPTSTTGGQLGTAGASYYDAQNLLKKSTDSDVPQLTFTIPSGQNLTFGDATTIHGTAQGTPGANSVTITPASDGIASVGLVAATGFTSSTVSVSVSTNPALTATIAVTKA